MTDYPDALPFQLRVLRALTDALKEITPDNGYNSDLSDFDPGDGVMTSRVYRGRFLFGDDDPIPMVSILEGVHPGADAVEPSVDTATGAYDWPLLIQGFVSDDPQNPTDPAYLLRADIRKRLAVEMTRKAAGNRQPAPLGFGPGKNCITKLSIGPGVARPADDVSDKAYCWLSLVIRCVENAADPYA